MKSKKGFTLIELLAVVVILVLVSLLAVPAVIKMLNKNREVTYDAKMKIILKQAKQYARDNRSFLYESEKKYNGYVCNVVTVKNLLDAGYLNEITFEGAKSTHITNPTNNQSIDDTEIVIYIKSKFPTDDELKYNGSYISTYKQTFLCSDRDIQLEYTYDFTGDEEVFNAPYSGYYKLEVWGAQGGSYNSNNKGGYGGYSYGNYYLSENDKLYVNVGGSGDNSITPGYNGGGLVSDGSSAGYYVAYGGGATSIATKSGLLSTLSNSVNDVIIVAGGGGGTGMYGSAYGTGGSGGGYVGGSPQYIHWNNSAVNSSETGGTQEAHRGGGKDTLVGCYNATEYSSASGAGIGTFGHGGKGSGGGFYGGSTYGACDNVYSGSGGSGYIGNVQLTNKEMYCYNCSPNNAVAMKTTSTSSANDSPRKNVAKSGDGAAKITYLGPSNVDRSVDVYYSYGTMNANLYTYNNLNDFVPEFGNSSISLTSSGTPVLSFNDFKEVYTDQIDLSKYNTVIVRKSNFLGTKVGFCQYPWRVNDEGERISPTWVSIGTDTYVADISSATRKDLHFYVNQYYDDNTGNVYYIAFSTKTLQEVQDNHSFITNN